MEKMSDYFPLWCKSNFSFLEGASHPEELMESCAELGLQGMALTDRDGVYGVVEAHTKAKELGLKLILGSEISIDDGSRLILLAMSRSGYAAICRLITQGRRRSAKGKSQVGWGEVFDHAEDVVALWGGARSLLVDEVDPTFVAGALKDSFGNRLYALATRHRKSPSAATSAVSAAPCSTLPSGRRSRKPTPRGPSSVARRQVPRQQAR